MVSFIRKHPIKDLKKDYEQNALTPWSRGYKTFFMVKSYKNQLVKVYENPWNIIWIMFFDQAILNQIKCPLTCIKLLFALRTYSLKIQNV